MITDIDIDSPRKCAWPLKRGGVCGRSTSWVKGEGFDGEGITYWSKFCEYHEIKARQDGVPTDLKAEELAACPFDLCRPDPVACVAWIEERHEYWATRLREWLRLIGCEHEVGTPFIGSIVTKARSWAGMYRPLGHECDYVLAYAMSQPAYDETIAHECCHAYQSAMLPAGKYGSHGELFEFLFRRGCGITVEQRECAKFNAYDAQQAIMLGKTLLPQVRDLKTKGKLLPHVEAR